MPHVRTHIADHIAEITLDNPPVNALNIAMLSEITAALRQAAADDSVRAVILSSALEKAFCAGLDLTGVAEGRGLDVHALLEKLYIELADVQYSLGKPSIAAVRGAARGGGMTLSISCNVIVAGDGATFGYPEIDVGLIPAIHFIHLPGIVGRHRAFELLFSGRAFSADEAANFGLVSRVVPDAEVMDEARRMARVFASKPALAMAFGHQAFMRCNDYRTDIGHITEAFCTIAATDDARSAVRAFLGKGRR